MAETKKAGGGGGVRLLSEIKAREFLTEHLPYEIDMLRTSFGLLVSGNFAGVLRNVLIEAVATHARNLIEFFCKKKNAWPITDFCKNDYVPMNAPKELYKKICAQVAHLSRNRTSEPTEKFNATDRQTIKLIEDEIERFQTHLAENYRSLFRTQTAPIRFC